jgi:hypothetical protein
MTPGGFVILATAVLILHLAVVAFVVVGLAAIVVGNRLGWSWANRPAWRWAHLATMVFVAAEAWLGIVCPLTTLEQWLAGRGGSAGVGETAGGDGVHPAGFVATWIERLLYYDLPAWVFVAGYTLFALAIAAAWIRYPPVRGHRRTAPGHGPRTRPPRDGSSRVQSRSWR